MKLDILKTASRILGWLGLFAVCLLAREAGAGGACTAARFNFWNDMGCNQANVGAGAPANNGPCPCKCPGMPRWWVSEPYIDLCMKDTPLSYQMSSGQDMAFTFFYRQRTQLPASDQVALPTPGPYEIYPGFSGSTCGTNASWGLNWNLSITIWDPVWENSWFASTYNGNSELLPPGFAPYSRGYQAFMWRPEGGIDYYNVQSGAQNTVNAKNLARITSVLANQNYPAVESRVADFGSNAVLNVPVPDPNGIYWGDSGVGLKLVNPDGSQDVYGLSAYPIKNEPIMLLPTAAGSSTERLFLTQKIDPQGRVTQFGLRICDQYEPDGRLFLSLEVCRGPRRAHEYVRVQNRLSIDANHGPLWPERHAGL